MADKETARQQIAALVEKFRNTPKATRDKYSEQQTREAFVLPMFRALGWDTENPAEMTAEEQISRGFVDFGFYLNNVPVFYLETKKVSEKLEKPEFMKQAINYAFLKGVTWAVLSDFEQLMIFNAEWEETDPIKSRFLNLGYERYTTDQFDDLWLLSKPSMIEHEIDRLAERFGKKSIKQPVTQTLFKQLTVWRRDLFAEMRTYGTIWSTDPRAVDNAVQKFLDRMIFIRTVEDRGVEPNQLRSLVRQSKDKNPYPNLLKLFRDLDAVYNSNLFAESDADRMEVHNADLIREIVEGLYGDRVGFVNYDFNAITSDVLGTVYEQYLGFKAQDPKGEKALDLGKQEKRKQSGIYYTPQFVVRYIVQQTLGKLLDSGVDAHSLRILDPACGSGSFLIEAFDLLDRWLAANGDETDRKFPRRRRMRILQENIYGVDLDEQAVEVTRLNLMLRAAIERDKLPLLTHIQYGNSLIDDSSITGNAFKWADRFSEVMLGGGFDVIIGNPPYIRIQTLQPTEVLWFSSNYKVATGNYDIYVLFVELALKLLSKRGKSGFILPSKFFTTDYGASLRNLLASNKSVKEIVDFGAAQVFKSATTYTSLLILGSKPTDYATYRNAQEWLTTSRSISLSENDVLAREVKLNPNQVWTFADSNTNQIIEKMQSVSIKLIDLCDISRGSSTGNDDIFTLDLVNQSLMSKNRDIIEIEPECLRTPIYATDFTRYLFAPQSKKRIIFPYEVTQDKYQIIAESDFAQKYPKAYSYLKSQKSELEKRKGYRVWYGFSATRNLIEHDQADLLVPLLANRGLYSKHADIKKNYCLMAGGGFSLAIKDKQYSPSYLLGLLNSTLLFWELSLISNVFRDGWVTCTKQYTGQLLIRTINFDDPADKAAHDRMVVLVEKMLRLKQEHAAAEASFSDERHRLAEEITQTDKAIDALVYQLYDLTPEEIALVEGNA